MQHLFNLEVAGKALEVEIGKLALQANGSVKVRYGDTVVLATAVMASKRREGINFLPLVVDYEEKLYAAGRIKGSRFIKREGRPTDEAVLTGRLIDRTLRPLFSPTIRNEIQIIVTVLCVDGVNDSDIPSMIAASLALAISDIPWQGPIGAVRVGQVEGEWVLNPSYETREKSCLDLVVSGSADKVNMLEGTAKEVKEEMVLGAVEFAQKSIKKILAFEQEIIEKVGVDKAKLNEIVPEEKLVSSAEKFLEPKLEKALFIAEKEKRNTALKSLENDYFEFIESKFSEDYLEQAQIILERLTDEIVHKNILEKEKRPDGRKLDQVRPITCQVGILPRTHGSALFERGETQILSVVTLAAPGAEQYLDGMEVVGKKHFFHHYNFPPYSVGETGRMSGPGRREIGHGALAEKAVFSLLPSKEDFPYTIRVVSEVLSSNGSSSMGSACGTSLALMDSGVPIKEAVAGLAIGLMMDNKGNYKVLSDIQGPEDHYGDMDFKVAGTKEGITVLQMDVKVDGITLDILKDVIFQARVGKLFILDKMKEAISKPREELSQFAPRVIVIKINPEKIRNVIGPGGKVINTIIEKTGVEIDIEDDGFVYITAEKAEAAEKAKAWIEDLTRPIKIGEIFQGKVTKVVDFGAFVEIFPGQEGLVHISELAPYRVNKVNDIVNVGDIIPVKVKRVDEQGKISLSLKDAKESPGSKK